MSAAPPLAAKTDKYEQVLSKYDWRSPFPPRGYQYGAGRGAKAFSTSAELSAATGAGAAPLLPPSSERSDLLDALDRLEEGRHKRHRDDVKGSRTSAVVVGVGRAAVHGGKKAKVELSMEDLATIGSGVAAQSLVKRKARTEDMDVVDDYVFADETAVVTASDLLRSRDLTNNQTLENILGMGSPTEQTTWITHSRAFREMGMTKKAQQTLVEGCRLTGNKGPLIWKERLEHMQDPAAQRHLLEEAVQVCHWCEELWLLLLQHEPPHEQLHWLQKAVMACPASESLWLRVLAHVPTPRDQKKIIRKALEVTPQLPSLWAMLARLENYETGKAIFNAAAAEHVSLQIVIEAAKYEEFHLKTQPASNMQGKEGGDVESLRLLVNEKIQSFVYQAAQRFLEVDSEKSRREWLEAAHTAASERYVMTSAYMYLHFVSDRKAVALSVPTTWMEDLMALVPDAVQTHDVLCAIWSAMLILLHTNGRLPHGGSDSNVMDKEMEVMTCALQLAPSPSINAALLALANHTPVVNVSVNRRRTVEKEEEEEELDRPAATDAALPVVDGSTTSATAASQSLPLPLTCVLVRTLLYTPLLSTVEVTLRIAKELYERGFYEGASRALKLGLVRHPTSTALFAAAAKALMAVGCESEAEQVLIQGTELVPADTDTAWVKLALHRRSKQEDIVPLLEKALAVFPKSERLWLMRMEAEGARIRRALDDVSMRGVSTAPLVSELRHVCRRALSAAHCRFSPTAWCYAAVQLESNLLTDASAARALLLEGDVVCGQLQHTKRAEVQAAFGLARCHVELTHAGRGTALEVVRETLQLLPKKDGCFTVPVGELVALSIDLEAPATRGRAAAQAVQHWRVRDPLVLAAVAKVYHAAGKHDKALEQALKAVKMSKGRCGDVVALWLKLASLPANSSVVAEKIGIADNVELTSPGEPIAVSVLLPWLCEQLAAEDDKAALDSNKKKKNNNINSSSNRVALKPNSGPLWVFESKAKDPSNVTLLGYRDSVEVMLQRVMDRIEL